MAYCFHDDKSLRQIIVEMGCCQMAAQSECMLTLDITANNAETC